MLTTIKYLYLSLICKDIKYNERSRIRIILESNIKIEIGRITYIHKICKEDGTHGDAKDAHCRR